MLHGPHRVTGYPLVMAKGRKPPARLYRQNYLREWRKHRGLSVEKLAELSGMSAGNISLFENRKQGYSAESLEAWARVLKCKPGDILDYPPKVVENMRDMVKAAAGVVGEAG